MATAKYSYRVNESLAKIAKMHHTNIKTLTVLNPWLVNPVTKKTEQFPGKVQYNISVDSDIAKTTILGYPIKRGTIVAYLYSKADFTGVETILKDIGSGGKLYRQGDNLETATPLYNVSYSSGLLLANNLTTLRSNYGSLRIEFIADLAKPYLVVPLIGNGNTSIEDYWDNIDNVTGVSLECLIDNASQDRSYNQGCLALHSPTDNNLLTESIVTMVNNEYIDTLNYYGHVDTDYNNNLDLGEDRWDSGSTTVVNDTKYLRTHSDYKTDFQSSTNLGTLVATALNEGSANMSERWTKDLSRKARDADGDYPGYDNLDRDSLNNIYDPITRGTTSHYLRNPGKSFFKTYENVGIKRNNDINSAVEVIIGNISITMPCWPEQLSDSVEANYDTQSVLGRSEPYVIYTNTGERAIEFTFKMHREMLQPLGSSSRESAETIEQIVRLLESAVYPDYDGTVSAVRTAVRVGKTLYIEGVMTHESTNWYGPIGPDLKYNQVDVTFKVLETTGTAKSRKQIASMGGYRV